MDAGEAEAKEWLFDQGVLALVGMRAAVQHAHRLFVPGRVELLGKHTDYAGGRSLLCAVERGICVVAAPRRDAEVRVRDVRRLDGDAFAISDSLVVPDGGWRTYAAAVVRRMARDFPEARTGADIAFASDLPSSAGLSSSSALVIGIFMSLAHVNDLQADARFRAMLGSRERLAEYLGAVESGRAFGWSARDQGVGTMGGSQDHAAILCCKSGTLTQMAFAPVRIERELPFARQHALVVASSGVLAAKTGNARGRYNRASSAVQRLLAIWHDGTGRTDDTLADALVSAPDADARLRTLVVASQRVRPGTALPPDEFDAHELLARLDQFEMEAGRLVPAAAESYASGNLGVFGALVDQSQQAAEEKLGNQVPETIALWRLARERGAIAASAFGAGFGGSVWALVKAAEAEEFADSWREAYRAGPGRARRGARWFITRPGVAATRANG